MNYREALNNIIFNFNHEVIERKMVEDNPEYEKWFIRIEKIKRRIKDSILTNEQVILFDRLVDSYSDLYNMDFLYMTIQGVRFYFVNNRVYEKDDGDILYISQLKQFHDEKRYESLKNNVKNMKQQLEYNLSDEVFGYIQLFDNEYVNNCNYWLKKTFVYAGKVISGIKFI